MMISKYDFDNDVTILRQNGQSRLSSLLIPGDCVNLFWTFDQTDEMRE